MWIEKSLFSTSSLTTVFTLHIQLPTLTSHQLPWFIANACAHVFITGIYSPVLPHAPVEQINYMQTPTYLHVSSALIRWRIVCPVDNGWCKYEKFWDIFEMGSREKREGKIPFFLLSLFMQSQLLHNPFTPITETRSPLQICSFLPTSAASRADAHTFAPQAHTTTHTRTHTHSL